jgi:hypothetical protein
MKKGNHIDCLFNYQLTNVLDFYESFGLRLIASPYL